LTNLAPTRISNIFRDYKQYTFHLSHQAQLAGRRGQGGPPAPPRAVLDHEHGQGPAKTRRRPTSTTVARETPVTPALVSTYHVSITYSSYETTITP